MVPAVASELHSKTWPTGPHVGEPRLPQPQTDMARDLQTRFFAVILALVSVAAIAFAWINFQKEHEFFTPYDGVWWMEDGGRLVAQRVDADGPGEKAGIKTGDRLVSADGRDVSNVGSLERQLYRSGVWSKTIYSLTRQGVNLEVPVILAPADRSLYDGLRLIALVYLGIGLYVLLRRWTAPKSTHFYVFCLVSFIFYSFHYTGKLNDFRLDRVLGERGRLAAAAGAVPALCVDLPGAQALRAADVPGSFPLSMCRDPAAGSAHQCGVLLAAQRDAALEPRPGADVRTWRFIFWRQRECCGTATGTPSSPILRQQMKWVTRGTILAVTPFTLFYVVPYLMGSAADASP